MSFKVYFRASSYAMIACGTLALLMSEGISLLLAVLFALVLVGAWKLEETRWQLPERLALAIVLASLPLFYIDWKYQSGGSVLPSDWVGIGALTHLIIFLSVIKLLQVKADRDWLFLYLISFFEVLLAAGLSISPLFFMALCLYVFCALSTIVCFEIKKARAKVTTEETRTLVVSETTWLRRLKRKTKNGETRQLPFVALSLLAMILILATPIFLIAPRFASGALTRSTSGLEGFVGFSDRVALGSIGRLQLSDRVVMRVRVEPSPIMQSQPQRRLRWRGIALDFFNGREWRQSTHTQRNVPLDRGFFKVDSTESLDRLTTQTFFLEPIDTPVLFAAASPVALQGALSYVRQDKEGGLSTREHPLERISYRAYSDTIDPDVNFLRADKNEYTVESAPYLELPDKMDARIATLAHEVGGRAAAKNRYDKAMAIENYLRTNFGYSLDLRATGDDPVADFLFNIKEGHCEYFATAMALMLRSEGIATRVVNGFQMGEYNDTADAYTVRQMDAHSWVEVYFPATDSWVAFDPTPASGQSLGAQAGGLRGSIRKYAEALELLWVQYVVAYDRQEQRSLAGSLRNRIGSYQRAAFQNADDLRARLLSWWRQRRQSSGADSGAQGFGVLVRAASAFIIILLAGILVFVYRRIRRDGWRRGLRPWQKVVTPGMIVEFYERLTKILAGRGYQRSPHQTPLEFAGTLGMPEVLEITRAYNQVRYGAHALTAREATRIEEFLRQLEKV